MSETYDSSLLPLAVEYLLQIVEGFELDDAQKTKVALARKLLDDAKTDANPAVATSIEEY
ncbi:MAG TPA: hypothetical protein VK662_12610 [Acidothermaceae bacterium]|jgi:hypothetical protein|nr:hypothetical protein [Acidothermaceae bacterium]